MGGRQNKIVGLFINTLYPNIELVYITSIDLFYVSNTRECYDKVVVNVCAEIVMLSPCIESTLAEDLIKKARFH